MHLHATEWVDILLGMETVGNPRNIVLDGVSITHHIFDAVFVSKYHSTFQYFF